MLLQVLEVSERLEGVLKSLIEHSAELGFAIIKAVIVFIVGRVVINLLNKLVRSLLDKRNFDPSVKSFVSSLVNVTLTILLIISIVGALGVQTTSFAALLASAGVAVGMALSGTAQNFAGGVMILLMKPYRVGDYISAQGQSGTVREIKLFSTVITTTDNQTIYIPNNSIATAIIDNYTTADLRRVDWSVGISYGDDVDVARRTILAMFAADARILKDPAEPVVRVSALADSSVNLTVRVWTKNTDYWDVYFEYNERFYKELPAAGINFPFPQMDVHVKHE